MTSYGPVQWSQTASLNSTADVNVYVKEGMAPSATNDQFRSIMQSFSKYRDDNNGTLVTGGSTTAATLATNQVFTALKMLLKLKCLQNGILLKLTLKNLKIPNLLQPQLF